MLAVSYLVAGLSAIVAGVVLLAGYEWGLIVGGGLLAALAVLEQRGAR